MKNTSSLAGGPLLTAIAAAALLSCHLSASALTLGRMTVQSALGEALRAEIDVTSITPEEVGTLRSGVAAPEAFRASGVEFNQVLAGAQVQLKRRPDGRSYFQIQGDRAVAEPFLDLIIDFSWGGGRLQRSYTLLIDPPIRTSAPPLTVTTPPVVSSATPPVTLAPAGLPQVARETISPANSGAMGPPAAPDRPKKTVAASAGDAKAPEQANGYKVRAGDTLSRIAGGHLPAGVSLDQMLVSLFRANPDAFVGNNMNRLRAGSLLSLPDAANATAISSADARQVIQAHSADFASFRSRLADAAPAVKASEPARQSGGKVSAAVQDNQAGAKPRAPDELKLTPPGAKANAEKLSKEAERKAADARVQELKRNVEELKGIKSGISVPPMPPLVASAPATVKPATPTAPPAPVALAPVAPPVVAPVVPPVTVPVAPVPPAPVLASAPVNPADVPASAPVAAVQPASSVVPQTSASAPSRPAVRRVPASVAPPEAEGASFLDDLMSNPFVLPGAVGLVALLAGLGFTRLRRKNPESSGETSFIESKLQPDSFFGVSGGQRVDTRDGGASSSSSLSYSLSQLDAIGDVDPVAEADVYLAYGRDLQAEEILKEALRTDPERLAIRVKLLEVYAKRTDLRNLETHARQLQELTGGVGEDWLKGQELGRQVDPENPLYLDISQAGAVDIDTSPEPPPDLMPDLDDGGFGADEPAVSSYSGYSAAPAAQPIRAAAPAVSAAQQDPGDSLVDFDLDIDLASAAKLTGLESTRPISTLSTRAGEFGSSSDFNFNTDSPSELGSVELGSTDLGGLELEETGMRPLPDLDLGFEQPRSPAASPPEQGPVDFDFGDLSLELDGHAGAGSFHTADGGGSSQAMGSDGLGSGGGDPLERKIELADEFRLIGDSEGARDLLEEVVNHGSPALRARAQALLNELG